MPEFAIPDNSPDKVPDDQYLSGDPIPEHLRGPVSVARLTWSLMWPGMGPDGSAELVVRALDHYYELRPRST